MTVEKGAPGSFQGRSDRELRSYKMLDSLAIEYWRIDHEPADVMEVCQERAEALCTRICKNLFLCNRQETSFYLLCMPADKQFKTSVVSKQLGVSRLHFASEEHMERLLGLSPGSVSILGLMNDTEGRVSLLMDAELKDQEFFACHPCINTSSLKFKTSELLYKLLPKLGRSPVFLQL